MNQGHLWSSIQIQIQQQIILLVEQIQIHIDDEVHMWMSFLEKLQITEACVVFTL